MDFELWTLLVEDIFGGFWLSVLGMLFLLLLIMVVFGRMSKMSAMNYMLLFFMVMAVGYGYKWFAVLLSTFIIFGAYMEFYNWLKG